MRGEMVTIKGIKDGLLISLDETEEWQTIITDLAARIDQQSAFFAGAKITVDLGHRPVPKYALGSLKALLERRSLALAAVLSESATTLAAADALDLRTTTSGIPGRQPQPVPAAVTDTPSINPEEEGTSGVMIRRTLRSGRVVHSAGHVVIFGDVNPGAEIIAAGDVIVWGALRGNVQAGVHGDTEAIVCALELIPTQLRIAGVNANITGVKRPKSQPEVALMRDNQIIVEAWSK
jgi:septum site-determining protein MinC